MKPIIVYWKNASPNPAKALILLEELDLPYECKTVEYEELKKPEYEAINPNGRLPATTDPNNHDITTWETGAIYHYLISTYDAEQKLTYSSVPEKYHLVQWSFFQASGQGPYFGQAAWFNRLHPTKIPEAQERYGNELLRVVKVLDRHLQSRDWLVGDKCTFADLAFVMWNVSIAWSLANGPTKFDEDEYPNFKRWMDAMRARPGVQRVLVNLQATEMRSGGNRG